MEKEGVEKIKVRKVPIKMINEKLIHTLPLDGKMINSRRNREERDMRDEARKVPMKIIKNDKREAVGNIKLTTNIKEIIVQEKIEEMKEEKKELYEEFRLFKHNVNNNKDNKEKTFLIKIKVENGKDEQEKTTKLGQKNDIKDTKINPVNQKRISSGQNVNSRVMDNFEKEGNHPENKNIQVSKKEIPVEKMITLQYIDGEMAVEPKTLENHIRDFQPNQALKRKVFDLLLDITC